MNSPVNTSDEKEEKPEVDNWYKLYGGSWSGLISPNAVAHPAKFSRKLIFKIFEHAIEEGWIKPGETCLDVFGGVALGALPAMLNGLHWVGVELEERFCALAQDNIDLWNRRYSEQMPNWGTAVIVQGDSRRLGEVLATARLALSSPPYAGSLGNSKSGIDWSKQADRKTAHPHGWDGEGYGQESGQLAAMLDTGFEAALALSSPVYIGNTASDDPDKRGGLYRDPKRRNDKTLTATYGADEAQLAQMPEGDLVAVISSPPYAGSIREGKSGIDVEKLDRAGPNSQARIMGGYGIEPGQLAALPEGDHAEALEAGAVTGRVECMISSPPWEASVNIMNKDSAKQYDAWAKNDDGSNRLARSLTGGGYGSADGQLGQETGPTFWAASREILEQVYQVLAPGGHAIWVLKMFVRSGRLVDFPGQWETLCQSVGFRTVCKHRAWLNKNSGIVQATFDGEEVNMEKWYKSFFRRLCESKGSPRIDWELVLCMEKPQ